VKSWTPILLGVIIAAALILISERGSATRIAPAGAVGQPGAPAVSLPVSTAAEPVAPPLSQPAPLVAPAPAAPRGFAELPPGQRAYIPILMYHYVRYVDPGADPLGYGLSVTPEELGAQLAWLKAAGYETVRMDVAAACIRGEGPCPARAVALTFDDGYMDAYTAALPVLQQHGFVATFYVVSGFVGQPGYLGWGEVRALRDAGMEIGAHSITHPDLTSLGLEQLRAEVAQSGAAIAAELGEPVRSFCYPGGRFNDTVAAVAAESGYTSSTTTVQDGPQGDPHRLPRLRIAGSTTLEGFQWMVQAYLP
jgi:peptidoglycan/xylan/chitin deacetylase (PgdA/CDA1 family)